MARGIRFLRIRNPLRLPPRGSFQRLVLVLSFLAICLIIAPLTFWYFVWYGFGIDREAIARGLSDPQKKGAVQTQVVLVAERAARGDRSIRSFYPRIIELSSHEDADVRATIAWMMGMDPAYQPFRAVLRKMIEEEALVVRRAAALSLAQFGDSAAQAPLETMLRPVIVLSTAAGRIQQRIQPGDNARSTTVLARIDAIDLPAPVEGTILRWLVPDGAEVRHGDPLLEMKQPPHQIEQTRAALRRLGRR